jgi:hypothetical protein
LPHTIDLADKYSTHLPAIVEWMSRGMSIDRIHSCLELREYVPKTSVVSLNEFIEDIDFQFEDPTLVIDTFMEFDNVCMGKSPIKVIRRIIEKRYDGDVLQAYRAALDNPAGFAVLIRKELRVLDDEA